MGQHFVLANLDKKEYADFPDSRGLWEKSADVGPRLYLAKLLNERWKGDRIVLIGDDNKVGLTYDEVVSTYRGILTQKDVYGRGKEETEFNKLLLNYSLLETGVAPVYYNPELNEYISFKEMRGDITNVLGALYYLTAFSFESKDEIPERGEDILPSRWAFSPVIPMETPPEGARSITEDVELFLLEDSSFLVNGESDAWAQKIIEKFSEMATNGDLERLFLGVDPKEVKYEMLKAESEVLEEKGDKRKVKLDFAYRIESPVLSLEVAHSCLIDEINEQSSSCTKVRGDTHRVKDLLKLAGFSWNPKERAWVSRELQPPIPGLAKVNSTILFVSVMLEEIMGEKKITTEEFLKFFRSLQKKLEEKESLKPEKPDKPERSQKREEDSGLEL